MTTLGEIRGWVLDMDGTIFLGDTLLPGAKAFLSLLAERGLPTLLMTNNSSKRPAQYAEKLARLGLNVPEAMIFTSGEATALTLKAQQPGARVYLVGTPALEEEFESHGFTLTGDAPDVAVLGFDTTLTYDKLWKLCDFVRGGLPYIATHPDVNCPLPGGFMPDIGATIAFVEASTERLPDQIVGKPNPPVVEAVARRTGLPVESLAMVGDRLYTDIALGAAGMTTVLVLTGETQPEDIPGTPHQPDYVMRDLQALHDALRASSETG